MIETPENHLRHFRAPGQETFEKTPRNISIDSVADFIARVAEGRPDNNGVRGAESSLTAILGRMAMDRRGEVTWDEMMSARTSPRGVSGAFGNGLRLISAQ